MFIIILFGIKQLKNYGRRHFKIFTNCHVSWDTLYYPIQYDVGHPVCILSAIVYKKVITDAYIFTVFTVHCTATEQTNISYFIKKKNKIVK